MESIRTDSDIGHTKNRIWDRKMILYPDKTTIITGPASLPVTLAEVKAHVVFNSAIDDGVFRRLIQTATDEGQKYTGRRFVTQTYDVYTESWPCDEWKLPFGWLQDVVEIYYTDIDNTTTLLPTSVYDVSTFGTLGSVKLAYGQSWPSETLAKTNPIRIRFVCGRYYGNEWEDTTVYAASAVTIPTSANHTGFAYKTTLGGTSAGTEPTWPLTIGATVVDGTVTWECVGQVVDATIRNAILISIASYYEERGDLIITQGGTFLDLMRIKTNFWFSKICYTQ